jgi:ribosomal RNA-processing protein 8
VADLLRPLCKGKKLADLGCGDGFLQIELNKGESRPLKTYSIDLMKRRDFVIKANLSRLPIKAGRIDIAVFCLSLMGTDYLKFICEANRVLRQGGSLIVAEVASRFASLRVFHLMMGHLGFKKVKAQRLGSTDFFVLLQY